MKKASLHLHSFYPHLGDLEKNLSRIALIMEKDADEKKSDVIVFPELATSGYLLENLRRDAALSGDFGNIPALEKIRKLSSRREIILGALLEEDGMYYNAALVYKNAELIHIHKKIYLPTYGMFDESRYWSWGSSLQTYPSVMGNAGILICEDAWHPHLADELARKKASAVFILSASPARGFGEKTYTSNEMWMARVRVYAQSFGSIWFYINRSGVEDGVYFKGQGIYAHPSGYENIFLEQNESAYFQFDPETLRAGISLGGPFIEDDFLRQPIRREGEQ